MNSTEVHRIGDVGDPMSHVIRIVHISDTHLMHYSFIQQNLIPDGDILVHSGDFDKYDISRLISRENDYLSEVAAINAFFSCMLHLYLSNFRLVDAWSLNGQCRGRQTAREEQFFVVSVPVVGLDTQQSSRPSPSCHGTAGWEDGRTHAVDFISQRHVMSLILQLCKPYVGWCVCGLPSHLRLLRFRTGLGCDLSYQISATDLTL